MRVHSGWSAWCAAFAAVTMLSAVGACRGAGAAADGAAAMAAAQQGTPGADTASTGEQLYQRCVPCHLATGEGVAGSYPPLVGPNLSTADDPTAAIRIMLSGLQGPTLVNGAKYDALMPPYGTNLEMSDVEVATVLTYVRQAWGNRARPVTADEVATVRARRGPQDSILTAASLERSR